MTALKNFVVELFSVFSRLLNVLTGGSAEMTLSARAYRDELWIEPFIDWVFFILIKEDRHCFRWWLIEVLRAQSTILTHELRNPFNELNAGDITPEPYRTWFGEMNTK